MKVLFVSSGNRDNPGILVKNQGESLKTVGIEVEYFSINGKGFFGYIKSIPKIRKVYKGGNFSLVHAHYSLSALAASLSGRFPLVVSLMGSDVYSGYSWRFIAKLFSIIRWNSIIVKSHEMKSLLNIKEAYVIPNGVNLDRFYPISKVSAREIIGLPKSKKVILFVANPERKEKNFALAKTSVEELKIKGIELISVFNKPNEEINYYLNAADVVLLTSKWEGSVNVIKEAMSCNCPIVSTDVGDVKWVLGNTEGCYLSSFEPQEVAKKLRIAISCKRTKGRERILKLSLDSESVARKILEVYKNTIET